MSMLVPPVKNNYVNILHDNKIENDVARDEVDNWSVAFEVNDQL